MEETKPEAVPQVCIGFSSVLDGDIRPDQDYYEVFQCDLIQAIGGLLNYQALVNVSCAR